MNLKILSYNIHKGNWGRAPSIHSIQSQIHENHSDIVFLQEVKESQCDKLKSQNYPHVAYVKNAFHRNEHHGNAILSKHQIIFSNNIDISAHRFEHRSLLHAVIKTDHDNQIIHLLCTHLGLFTRSREKQLRMIAKYINNHITNNEPIILGGDFNDWSGRATQHIIHDLEFQEAFLSAHHSYAKTFPSLIPVLKLDRMYFRGFNVNYAIRLTSKHWRHLSDHIAIEVSLKLIT